MCDSKPRIIKVVLLGNGNVGKSSLMNRFVNNIFEKKYLSTLGVDFLNKDIEHNGRKYCLQIWDTAGQEKFKSLRTPFYRGSDICILAYCIDDKESFDHLSMWKNEFIYYAKLDDPDNFPFAVIGNKCDLPECDRNVTTEEAKTWCDEQGYPFIETSAKKSVNVKDAFNMALDNWLKSEEKLPSPCVVSETVNLNVEPKRYGCC